MPYQRAPDARLVEATNIEIENGIVYTTVIKDGKPYTTAMLFSNYLRHHHKAAALIKSAMLAQEGVVEKMAAH